jgi:acid phosphatase
MHRVAAAALGAVLLLTACSSGSSPKTASGPTGTSSPTSDSASAPSSSASSGSGASPAAGTAGIPRPAHVMLVIFENKDASAVNGSPKAPYLNSLAASGARFTDAHGERHPSQPNYLALFSGSTHGVTSDKCPLLFTGDNMASQLASVGKTFVGYSEDLPEVGYDGCTTATYARKHNPWSDFAALPPTVNQPLSALPTNYDQLPTVAWIVPNLCHDMHDCDVATGDAWAKSFLTPYVSWAKEHKSLLIVTFDEAGGGSPANHIATFVVGAGVKQTTVDTRIDHYSILRTIEAMYGLPPIGEAANAQPFTGIWTG